MRQLRWHFRWTLRGVLERQSAEPYESLVSGTGKQSGKDHAAEESLFFQSSTLITLRWRGGHGNAYDGDANASAARHYSDFELSYLLFSIKLLDTITFAGANGLVPLKGDAVAVATRLKYNVGKFKHINDILFTQKIHSSADHDQEKARLCG